MTIDSIISGGEIDTAIKSVINKIHLKGPVDPTDFELLSYVKKFRGELFGAYESKIINVIGLFYKTNNPLGLLEEIYSIFGDSIEEETGRKFTPVQADAFNRILLNTYFSFSAPTSAGKSYLFRELILSVQGDIIIVVPSRALIAEYFISVVNLVDKSVFVSQFIENVNLKHASRKIFIITPERGADLFKNIPSLSIELVLLDEAQISEEEVRGMRFDSFVRRIDKFLPLVKKVFTHPFVLNPEAQLFKHNFSQNSDSYCYKQNTVGKIYQFIEEGQFSYFSPFETNSVPLKAQEDIVKETLRNDGTVLIYVSKTKIYDGSFITEFDRYINLCHKITHKDAVGIINELRTYIGASASGEEKHSLLIEMMERGIVIHHGSIPLKGRLIIEKFVNKNFAKICFSTSTLIQGINMPFDVVWINNFKFAGSSIQKNLDLKNLIGRAGRSTKKVNNFDYGYVIIEKSNLRTFKTRMKEPTVLSTTSRIDENIQSIPEDLKDIVQAIKEDSFNDVLQLTDTQVKRIRQAGIDDDVKLILDNFIVDDDIISGEEYYKVSNSTRRTLKKAFQNIFISHLRRKTLNKAEQGVLSTAIPLLLWQIQGKGFAEVVSLRYSYLTQRDEQRKIRRMLRKKEVSSSRAKELLDALEVRFSQNASSIPSAELKQSSIFPRGTKVSDVEYDLVVYDTYDYLDKVIGYSLKDPLAAAFQIYFDKTRDVRANIMANYIRFGTNDNKEIWLLRYGFSFEEIEWIKNYVVSIDENEIVFDESVSQLPAEEYSIVERFIFS